MKVRSGFVSNSSSSSFIVAGIRFTDADDLHEQLVKHFGDEVAQTEIRDEGCDYMWVDELEYSSSKIFAPLTVIGDAETDSYYIGKTIDPEGFSFKNLTGENPVLTKEALDKIEQVSNLFGKSANTYFHTSYC